MSYSIVLLICRNTFLRPTSLLLVMIITMFTYGVVILISMLFLWLHIVVYVKYFDYVLHYDFMYVYRCIPDSNLTLFLEPKWVEWQN